MSTNTESAEKSIVAELHFDVNTAKRATWESWEFTVLGPHQIEVRNASYGFLSDDHTYTVGVENHDGAGLPAECGCPADIHRDQDCKHKVALATVGGPVVLDAAIETEVRADGGQPDPEVCPNGEDWCAGPGSDDLPCFDCYTVAEGSQ